jgi:hypothetical protein
VKFSIVFPSKGNLSGVKTLLNAFGKTISCPGNLEVLIAVDNDDLEYAAAIKQVPTTFVCKVLTRERSDNFSNDYYNWLAKQSQGDAIQCFNDDAYYLTKDWDAKIRDKVSGKNIWFADIWDNTRVNNAGFQPCFPMVSRKAYEALGFVLHPQIKVYPADKKIYEVYVKAGCVVDCTDVKIQHDRVALEKTRIDSISRQPGARGYVDTSADAMKLVQADG